MTKVKAGVSSFFSSVKQKAVKTYAGLNNQQQKPVTQTNQKQNEQSLEHFDIVDEDNARSLEETDDVESTKMGLIDRVKSSDTLAQLKKSTTSLVSSAATGINDLANTAHTNVSIIKAELIDGEGEGDKQMPNESDHAYQKRLDRLQQLEQIEAKQEKKNAIIRSRSSSKPKRQPSYTVEVRVTADSSNEEIKEEVKQPKKREEETEFEFMV